MKIILSAFGNKLTGTMEVPENTTPKFELVLYQPISAVVGYSGNKIGSTGGFGTRCFFEWTGKYQDNARLYALCDIIKMDDEYEYIKRTENV